MAVAGLLLLITSLMLTVPVTLTSPPIEGASENRPRRVAVVGGGLAGLCAAFEAATAGASVVLIEKLASIGGNSAKATSGINGFGTLAQQRSAVHDTYESFYEDTLRAGKYTNNAVMVEKLVHESTDAIQWLGQFGMDLSSLTQCGGHSYKRTHRMPAEPDGRPVPVGWRMVKTLEMELLKMQNVELMLSTQVVRLLHITMHSSGEDVVKVVGARVRRSDGANSNAEEDLMFDAVILTSGGYAYSSVSEKETSLLAKYAPRIASLPTTSGPQADGSGIMLALQMDVDVSITDMDQVQIHPTGFVDPNHPNAHSKMLCPESLRGCGAILVDDHGHRFSNELGTRDYLSNRITNIGGVAHMIFNEEIAECFGKPALSFYMGRGLVRQFPSLQDMATALGLGSDLEHTLEDYEKIATKDEGSEDPFGKTVFPVSSWLATADQSYYVADVTPVVHYTMGGLRTDATTAVLRSVAGPNDPTQLERIIGLYAAGEVTGGVHGSNRLAGNSLLECVVFGRTAGKVAAGNPNFNIDDKCGSEV